MRRKPVWAVLALLALAACSDATPLEPGGEPAATAFTAEVERLVPEWQAEFGIPGVAVGLLVEGRAGWLRGFGDADREAGVPVDPERTVFQAASISKSLVAWSVLALDRRGALDLDRPIEDYLTRWQFPFSQYDSRGVTARRLLSHTAGTTVHGYPGFAPGTPLPTLEESLAGGGRGRGLVRIEREPGTRWQYSGGGFTVLQLAIEEVTGRGFSAVLDEDVLGPLGMGDSSFDWRPDLRPRTAVAYGEDGEAVPNFLFTAKAAGGLYTTLADLMRLMEATVAADPTNPVLGPDAVAEMLEEPPIAVDYGLGHMILTLKSGERVMGHAGINQGWRSFWVVHPPTGAGIAVLSNSDHDEDLPSRLVCAWTRSVMGSRVAFPLGIKGCS